MAGSQIDGQALVVGSSGGTLGGIDHDVGAVAEMLRRRGFTVDVRTGDQATRAGILAGYDALIANVGPDKPAVFYYSGHGFHATVDNEPTSFWQGISPTDVNATSTTDFRGITSWELSIKQAELTKRTRNVTVILDCCYASQMSRDGAVCDAAPRALPHPVRLGFAAHLRALRAMYGAAFDAVGPTGNRNAVRLVACGQDESAYEYRAADGERRGAFTEAVLDVLREVGDAQVSWAALGDAIRARVHRRFLLQRPDIEGPAHRLLFSLEEEVVDDTFAIIAEVDGFRLAAGYLHGVRVGDVYGVMPPRSRVYRATDAIAEVQVCKVFGMSACAELRGGTTGYTELPPDAVAISIKKAAARWAVKIEAPDPDRAAVEAAVAASRTLRLAEPDETVLATLRLSNGALTIEDRLGPLFPGVGFPEALRDTVKDLANLGAAQGVRELEGEHGVSANDLEIEWGALDGGQAQRMPNHGGALALCDKLYVKITSKAPRELYAHVFNMGLRGKITLLTDFSPGGVKLSSEQPELMLGRRHDGAVLGLKLSWPQDMPRETFPRIDEIVVIVTDAETSLRSLETVEHVVIARGEGSKLQDLLAQLQDGVPRDTTGAAPIDGFFVKRLSYFLYPRDAMMADIPFEVDENPWLQSAARAPEAWLADHGELVALPRRCGLAIRIADLVVENSRVPSGDIRIDALICTRSMASGGGYATWTGKYRSARDGAALDPGDGLIFDGDVYDFVDIYVWGTRDTQGSPDLAQLLAQRSERSDFKDAVRGLLIHRDASPWIGALGASAILSRIAYQQLRCEASTSGGLYRTSFLARERFGVGRHPVHGVHDGLGISFSLRIESHGTQLAEK